VQQGSIISPLLYSIFIDDITDSVRKGPGFRSPWIGIDNFNILLYADDIAIVAKSEEDLNSLLKACSDHARENNYKFSPKKCVFISKNEPKVPIILEGTPLQRVNNFCYLGIYFDFKGFDKKSQIEAIRTKALKTEKFFKSLGMNGDGWHTASKVAVYKSFIRSKIEYGMAILQYSKKEIDDLDKIQRETLCDLFSLSRNSSANTLRIITGLVAMQERQSILQAKFILKSLESEKDPTTLLPKVTLWMRKANLSPLIDDLRKTNKIQLCEDSNVNKMILKKAKDEHMKELMSKTKVFQSGILASLKWEKLMRLVENWKIDKKAIRTIIKLLTYRLPGKVQPCKICNERTCREHVIQCNKSIWLALTNTLAQIKGLQCHLKSFYQGVVDFLQLPSHLIAIAASVTQKDLQAKIINELSSALIQSVKNCIRESNPFNPP
jgi:hypothetical protein